MDLAWDAKAKDNLLMLVVTKSIENAELYASEIVHSIKSWLHTVKLSLPLIIYHKKKDTIIIRVGAVEIISKSVVEYLRLLIDVELNVTGHLEYMQDKGSNVRIILTPGNRDM